MATQTTFPVGARVYVDGKDQAIIAQVFPEGSSALTAPHYCVRFVGGGSEQVRVAMHRVGVDKLFHCPLCGQRVKGTCGCSRVGATTRKGV